MLVSLRAHLASIQISIRNLGSSIASLGDDALGLYGATYLPGDDSAEREGVRSTVSGGISPGVAAPFPVDAETESTLHHYGNTLEEIKDLSTFLSDKKIQDNIMSTVDAEIANITSLKPMLRERELLRLDYESRAKAVQDLRESVNKASRQEEGSGSFLDKLKPSHKDLVTKLEHKEEKLKRTKEALEEATNKVYSALDTVEQNRFGDWVPSLLLHPLALLREFNMNVVEKLNAAPTSLPRVQQPPRVQHHQSNASPGLYSGYKNPNAKTSISGYSTTARGHQDYGESTTGADNPAFAPVTTSAPAPVMYPAPGSGSTSESSFSYQQKKL